MKNRVYILDEFQGLQRMAQEAFLKSLEEPPKNTFFIAGLILYLGEGGKKDDTRIVLANTDPEIIRFFIKWLIDFLDVNKESIRVQLHLYENMALEKEQKIWQNITGLNKSQFYKTSVRKLQKSSFTYQGSHGHGTCSVYVLSVEKKRRVSMAIKAFLDSYLSGG